IASRFGVVSRNCARDAAPRLVWKLLTVERVAVSEDFELDVGVRFWHFGCVLPFVKLRHGVSPLMIAGPEARGGARIVWRLANPVVPGSVRGGQDRTFVRVRQSLFSKATVLTDRLGEVPALDILEGAWPHAGWLVAG